jgi:hypothetical protein
MTTRLDCLGKLSSRSKSIYIYIYNVHFEVWMREIWLLEDLHVGHTVKPGPGGGFTGLLCQIRVRSCISTWDLYRLRLLLGQDLPPYIYEGPWPIEGIKIESIHYIYFLSSQHLFQPPCFSSIGLHGRR